MCITKDVGAPAALEKRQIGRRLRGELEQWARRACGRTERFEWLWIGGRSRRGNRGRSTEGRRAAARRGWRRERRLSRAVGPAWRRTADRRAQPAADPGTVADWSAGRHALGARSISETEGKRERQCRDIQLAHWRHIGHVPTNVNAGSAGRRGPRKSEAGALIAEAGARRSVDRPEYGGRPACRWRRSPSAVRRTGLDHRACRP